MVMTKFLIIVCICAGFLNKISAQIKNTPTNNDNTIDGDYLLSVGNYASALEIYKGMYKTTPQDKDLNYKIALCYLRTNINRLEAIKYLEFVVKDEKFDPEAWFNLGYVYSLAYKLDDAINAYEKYKKLVPKKADRANLRISKCNNAIEFIKHPVSVSFNNLGKDLNSPYPDYYPWITKDENFLVFTSRRKGNIGDVMEVDGFYSSDIYTSSASNGKWGNAKNIGSIINSNLDEQAVGLKSDGSEMVIYIDHIDIFGDLFLSKKKGGAYQKMAPLAVHINKKIENSGSVCDEGNTIFFARKEKDSENSDIYMSRMLPSGQWGEPQKLNDKVNTIYNEDFPYLSTDGKTLYFSSEGHEGMGGYDLFKSEWNQETNSWTKAVNLGYPINTTDDDRNISISADQKVGYISANRPDGYGDLDIYRILFNSNKKYTIYKGMISYEDSLNTPIKTIATIITKEQKTNEEYNFTAHSKNRSFILALPAGTYNLTLNSVGYKKIKETIIVSDIGTELTERTKSFKLIKE